MTWIYEGTAAASITETEIILTQPNTGQVLATVPHAGFLDAVAEDGTIRVNIYGNGAVEVA